MAKDKLTYRIEPADSSADKGDASSSTDTRAERVGSGSAEDAREDSNGPVRTDSSDGSGASAQPQIGVGAPDGRGHRDATSAPFQGSEPAEASGARSDDIPSREGWSFARAARRFDEAFPQSRHAVAGGVLGLVVAMLIFTIGLLKTLVICVLVLAGVAAGQFFDGDPKLFRVIQSLMRRR